MPPASAPSRTGCQNRTLPVAEEPARGAEVGVEVVIVRSRTRID
jgi:hypothetical protein